MKRFFKKGIAAILCVCMVLGVVPLGGFAGLNVSELFAFKAEAAASSVTYYVDGEIYEIIKPTSNYFELPIPDDPTKSGYSFVGWADSSGTVLNELEISESIKNYDPILDGKELAFYAVWHKNSGTVGPYTVTFYVDGVYYDFATYSNGIIVTPTPPEKTGYSFAGWSTANGNIVNVANYAATVNDSFAVYAVYVANEYDVDFVATPGMFGDIVPEGVVLSNGMSKYTVLRVKFGAEIPFPEVPELAGYEFDGWKTPDGADAPTTLTEEGAYYKATWKAISYPIVLDYGEYQKTFYGTYGSYIQLPEPMKTGFTFKGWVVDGVRYVSQVVVPVGGSYCVAEWQINQHNVKFYEDDEKTLLVDTKVYEYGSEVVMPIPPEKEGYDFLGWADDFGEPIPAGTVFTMPDNDLNFSAKWEAKAVTAPEKSPQFPSGYDFDEDSYSFANKGRTLTQKHFTDIYGYSKGKLMYEKHRKGAYNGVCFGMAYTTAAILKGYPDISNISNDGKICSNLNEVDENSKVNIGDMTITLLDYIKYAFVYQWSWDSAYSRAFSQLTSTGIIEDSVKNDSYVVLDIMTKEFGGHTVLAVGYEETADNKGVIYINDSNSPGKLQTITVENGGWKFSNSWVSEEINSANTKYVACHTDYSQPYYILKTGAYVATDEECANNYIYGIDPIDGDKLLLNIGTNNCTLNAKNYLAVSDYTANTAKDTDEAGILYWIKDDKTISISDIVEDGTEISLAGNDVLLNANVNEGTIVTMTIDEAETSIAVNVEAGEEYSVSFETLSDNEEEIVFSLSGVSSGEEIKAVETEIGVEISGATSGNITLTVDGELVSKHSFGNAQGNIIVEYDSESASNGLEINYENTLVNLGDLIEDFEIINKDTIILNLIIALENYSVAYSSSDSNVVSISDSGNVKAKNIGTAIITIAVTDEYGNVYSDICNIIVLPREFNITWNIDGEETTTICKEGTEINAPENPEKVGYTFAGWTPKIPDVMPAEDLTFTAVFIPNSYNAVFDANGGKWADGATEMTVPIDYDAEITAPENPAKQGYVFSCWSPEIGVMDDINGKKFVAQWLAATDTRYTVETYTMNTAGEYEKSTQVFSGTTNSMVNAEYNIENGFVLNEEKSVLSGTVAADNSLVLKVYIDRNKYTLTTVVDGVSTKTEYFYGSIIAEPAVTEKTGYKFVKWDKDIPDTMPATDLSLTAQFKCVADVSIRNNGGSKTINYGETLRLTAVTANIPDGAKIYWYVDGMKKGEGTTFDVSFESGTKTVEIKIVDANGNVLKNADGSEISDSQKVSVNSGLWQKIVSFFKNLFRINRTVIQAYNKIEW